MSYEEYFVPAFSSLHICAAGIYRCITIFGDILPERFEEYILGSLPCLIVLTYAASIYLSICAF